VALAAVMKPDAAPRGDKPHPASGVWGGGAFELESVTAQDEVKLATRDGRSAAAQQAHVTLSDEGTVAELMGQPATLSDGTSTLTGPHIRYEQASQRAAVQGPGTLALVVRDDPDRPARPVNAAWESSLSYDGLANRAELTGSASVGAPAADGSKQLASADRIIIELADAPADAPPRPTTAAARVDGGAAAAAAAKAGAAGAPGADHFDLAGNKVIRRITLAGNAQVQSTLDGQRAGELRRIHLLAPEVRYDVESKRAEVPSAGRLLVQDTLPPRDDAQAGNRMLGNFRGATAFQWARDLVFDQAENRMTMSGDVLIVHEDPARTDQTFRLEAAQVRADMIDDAPARKADTGDAPRALFGPSELHLRSLSATGDIRLAAPQIQIEAQDVTYDAQRELLTARGSERQPVELYNESGLSRGAFQEVVWDARAEQIQRMREVRGQVRR
jgi:lipopolysaccharide export system protein LptA